MTSTTKNRIQATVIRYLKALGSDWYEDLAEAFEWKSGSGKSVNTNHYAYNLATEHGLEYVGHGCTRVVFRVSNLIVKIEKKSKHRSHAFQFGNRNEIETYSLIEEEYSKILPFILKPLATFTYDGVPCLVYPELENNEEDVKLIQKDYNAELDATKVFRFLDYVLDDQYMGINTFAVTGFPVSIDFGVCPETGYASNRRPLIYMDGIEEIETIMEGDAFRSFQRDMAALYELAEEELERAA
jgi:hypothetical protein